MELLQGAHDKRELRKIEQELNLFRRLELQQAVFDLATDWIRRYTLSHGLLLPDAIIAASRVGCVRRVFLRRNAPYRYIEMVRY